VKKRQLAELLANASSAHVEIAAERAASAGDAAGACAAGGLRVDPPEFYFRGVGLRVAPRWGAAIIWPNVDLDNVYDKHPQTKHATDEVMEGHTKCAANAWVHLRNCRDDVGVSTAMRG
jgi:hypothetical protein